MPRALREILLPLVMGGLCIAVFFIVFLPPSLRDLEEASRGANFDFQSYFLPKYMFGTEELLRGRLPVQAAGVLRTQKGVGAFTLESASVGGLPVPKTVLQELVSYYSRSETNPKGVDFEAPFRLPAKIQEIRTSQGQALVVQ